MIITIKNADFVAGATTLSSLPVPELPEIAMLGRSNVGKSTLINRITERKKLARTSSTPGRTTELNFFKIALGIKETKESEEQLERNLMLVDLPGFGYAKFSKTERERLSKLTLDYISGRDNLKVICLLNDCRRKPEADELAIRKVAFELDKRLLIVVTKVDKLNQKERHANVKTIAEAYGLSTSDLILTGEKTPNYQIWERLLPLVNE